MANTLAPFGFSPEGTVGGSTPNFKQSIRKIALGNTTPIFKGDAVVPVVTSATGYITQATASTTPLAGIFWGCKYLSVSRGITVWSPYWPGSDAASDPTAYIYDDPQMQFLVQSSYASGPIPFSAIDQNVQLAVGTGNTTSGLSGMTINGPAATTSTYPFTVVGFVQDPTGANGTDITTAYNYVIVTFNNQVFRTGNTSIS